MSIYAHNGNATHVDPYPRVPRLPSPKPAYSTKSRPSPTTGSRECHECGAAAYSRHLDGCPRTS